MIILQLGSEVGSRTPQPLSDADVTHGGRNLKRLETVFFINV